MIIYTPPRNQEREQQEQGDLCLCAVRVATSTRKRVVWVKVKTLFGVSLAQESENVSCVGTHQARYNNVGLLALRKTVCVCVCMCVYIYIYVCVGIEIDIAILNKIAGSNAPLLSPLADAPLDGPDRRRAHGAGRGGALQLPAPDLPLAQVVHLAARLVPRRAVAADRRTSLALPPFSPRGCI